MPLLALTAVLLGGYSFTVDGRAEALPLTTLSDGAAVVDVRGVLLWLDAPRDYAFTLERDARGALWLIRLGKQVVGLVVAPPPAATDDVLGGGQGTIEDALNGTLAPTPAKSAPRALTRDELAGLRGVLIKGGGVLDDATLPGGHLCVRLGDGALGGPPASMPAVVPVCLKQEDVPVPPASLRAARYLERRASFTAADAKEGTRIEALFVSGEVQWAALLALPALAQLKVFSAAERATAWKGRVEHLTRLELSGQGVSSLAALDAPRLTSLLVEGRDLAELPRSLPSLEVASVGSAPKLTDAEVVKFERAHPKAHVQRGWAGKLRAAVARADRVRVRSGGLCHRAVEEEQVLVDRASKADVEKVLATVELDEAGSRGFCSCCGGPTLEFFAGTELLASVGLQHATHVRWTWGADARLKTDALVKLLAGWGVKELATPRPE